MFLPVNVGGNGSTVEQKLPALGRSPISKDPNMFYRTSILYPRHPISRHIFSADEVRGGPNHL